MKRLAVLTPSWRHDLALFRSLHRSVLENTPENVIHHVVVPHEDVDLFRAHVGARGRVWDERAFLPRQFVAIPAAVHKAAKVAKLPPTLRFAAVNLRAPLP